MAELTTAMNELLKGKYADENLPIYINGLSALYGRLSMLRMAMNYYMFAEIHEDLSQEFKDQFSERIETLQNMVKLVIVENDAANAKESLLEFRKDLISDMDILTAHIDRLALCEYIMNRIEFKYKDGGFEDSYYNKGFEQDIYRYITSERDNQVINMKIVSVIRELPMRLSKNKFEDLLRNAYSLYNTSDRGSIDDFTYRIRSSACFHHPDHMDEKFERLTNYWNQLKDLDAETITKEQYEVLATVLYEASELAAEYSDLIITMTDIVNDLLILSMTTNALKDVKETSDLSEVIAETYKIIQGDRDFDESLAEAFIAFEGVQEKISSYIFRPDSALEEIMIANTSQIDALGYRESMTDLSKISKLQSASTFAALDLDDNMTEFPGEIYLKNTVDALAEEFSSAFASMNRSMKRAVMASVIGNLPVYFNNLNEFMEYVRVSLSQCSDSAERQACMNIIHMLMDNE